MIDVSITLKAEDSLLKALTTVAQIFASGKIETIEQPKQDKATVSTPIASSVSQAAPVPAVPVIPSMQQPVPATVAPVTEALPQQSLIPTAPVVSPAEYTLEQLSYAAAPLVDAGKLNELSAVMQKLGVRSLQELPKDKYGLFATEIRALGANI